MYISSTTRGKTYPGFIAAESVFITGIQGKKAVVILGGEIWFINKENNSITHKSYIQQTNKRRKMVIYCYLPGGAIPGRIGAGIPGIIMGGAIPGITGGVYINPIPASTRGFLDEGSPSLTGLPPPRNIGEREKSEGLVVQKQLHIGFWRERGQWVQDLYLNITCRHVLYQEWDNHQIMDLTLQHGNSGTKCNPSQAFPVVQPGDWQTIVDKIVILWPHRHACIHVLKF